MNNHNIIFLEELKEAVGVESGYAMQDAKMLKAIAAATKTIQDIAGRNFSMNDYTEFLDTVYNSTAFYDIYGISSTGYASVANERGYTLKNTPIDLAETFSVYYDVNLKYGEDTLLDPSKYTLDPETGKLYLNFATVACRRALKVIYTAGYPSTTVGSETALSASLPADLVQACVWQAQHTFDKMNASSINSFYSGTVGKSDSYRYVNVAGITPEAAAIAVRYKRYRGRVI